VLLRLVDYVFLEVQMTKVVDCIVGPYTSKDNDKKHGKYSLKMGLSNNKKLKRAILYCLRKLIP